MSNKDRCTSSFRIPTKIVFGEGTLAEMVKETDGLGAASEVSRFATIKDHETKVKTLIFEEYGS
jgi:hypothetical protein